MDSRPMVHIRISIATSKIPRGMRKKLMRRHLQPISREDPQRMTEALTHVTETFSGPLYTLVVQYSRSKIYSEEGLSLLDRVCSQTKESKLFHLIPKKSQRGSNIHHCTVNISQHYFSRLSFYSKNHPKCRDEYPTELLKQTRVLYKLRKAPEGAKCSEMYSPTN